MLKRNILLTAFRGTSAEEPLKGAECDWLLLPNDKVRDSEILIKAVAPISHNEGTSFCNRLYWKRLQYILQNELDVKMVFVHIPFMKNITEIERFNKKILDGIDDIGK